MTDNERRFPGPSGQEPKGQDPLLELTRLFNLDRNVGNNKQPAGQSFSRPTDAGQNQTSTSGHNEPDLSFLDSDPESNLPLEPHYEQQPDSIDNSVQNGTELDFLPESVHNDEPVAQEPDLPFNELYDAPSFSPTAQTRFSPVELPLDFHDESIDQKPDYPGNIDQMPYDQNTPAESYVSDSRDLQQDDFDFLPSDTVPPHIENAKTSTNQYSQTAPIQTEPFFQEAPVTSTYQSAPVNNPATQSYTPPVSDTQSGEEVNKEPYFDDADFDFDKELENLLIEDPIRPDNEPAAVPQTGSPSMESGYPYAQNAADQYTQSERVADQNSYQQTDFAQENQQAQTTQPNYHDNLSNEIQGQSFNQAETYNQTPTEPEKYSPPEEDDHFNTDDPFGFDEVFASEIAAQVTNSQIYQTDVEEPDTETNKDPFGLEDLSRDEHIVSPAPVDESYSERRVAENFSTTNQTTANLLPPYDEVMTTTPNLSSSSQSGTQTYTEQQGAPLDYTSQEMPQARPNSTIAERNDNLPPDVDTYKFADDIVETTEAFDLPEVPYPEEDSSPRIDTLEDEYADVFSVGKKQEPVDNRADQNEFFNEAYAQSGFAPQNGQNYTYETEPVTSESYPASKQAYDEYPDYPQSSYAENAALADLNNTQRHTPLSRKFMTGGLAALLLLGGGYALSKFFIPSSKNGESTIIRADNAPYKVPAENTDNNANTPNNQDVYNHAKGSENTPQGEQNQLVDRSETPEDLTALNEQIPNSASPYVDSSSVDDAIAASQNQTIPTREVQAVVVNPDGTIVPDSSPSNASDDKTQPQTNAPNTQPADNKPENIEPEQTVGAADTKHEEQESELSKIINDDAKSENAKSQNAKSESVKSESVKSENSDVKPSTQPKIAEDQTNSNIQTAAQRAETTRVPTVSPTPPIKHTPITSTVGAGGYYVQIASQPTQESALTSMSKAKAQFGSIIGSLPLNIQPATIPGKGTYYRVRVQVGPRENAVDLCNRIKNQNGNCFVGK